MSEAVSTLLLLVGVSAHALALAACGSNVTVVSSDGGASGDGGYATASTSSAGGSAGDPCGAEPCRVGSCLAEVISVWDPDEPCLLQGPVLAGEWLYWSCSVYEGNQPFSWEAYRAPLCGGSSQLLAQGSRAARGLFPWNGAAYFAELGPESAALEELGTIFRVGDDSIPAVVVDGLLPNRLFIDDDGIYWIENGQRIASASHDASTLFPKVVDSDIWDGLVVDDKRMYWGSETGVHTAIRGDESYSTFAELGAYVFRLGQDEQNLFALEIGEDAEPNRLLRLPKSTPENLAVLVTGL